METQSMILKLAEEAIEKGFGSYYCLPTITWNDLKAGYEAGKRFDYKWEAKLLAVTV